MLFVPSVRPAFSRRALSPWFWRYTPLRQNSKYTLANRPTNESERRRVERTYEPNPTQPYPIQSRRAQPQFNPIQSRHGNINLSEQEEEDIHVIKDGMIREAGLRGAVAFRSARHSARQMCRGCTFLFTLQVVFFCFFFAGLRRSCIVCVEEQQHGGQRFLCVRACVRDCLFF